MFADVVTNRIGSKLLPSGQTFTEGVREYPRIVNQCIIVKALIDFSSLNSRLDRITG